MTTNNKDLETKAKGNAMSHNLQFCILSFCAVIASAFGGVNKSFGNCDADGANFAYSPEWLNNTHCSRLAAADYAAANWWPVTDIAPACDENHYANPIGWTKRAVDNEREEISWAHNLPPETNEMGEVIWFPVTNTVRFTTYAIERNYEVKAKPLAPIAVPSYSIADLTFWCAQQGKMEAVTAALKEMDMYEVYLTTQTVSADNELFQPTLKAIAQKVGLTDAEVSEALAYSLIGGAE